jgi:hypothetical protein
MAATKSNGLVCFTNCLLPQEDGSLVEKDLWIDEWRGVILDAQVGHRAEVYEFVWVGFTSISHPENVLHTQGASKQNH